MTTLLGADLGGIITDPANTGCGLRGNLHYQGKPRGNLWGCNAHPGAFTGLVNRVTRCLVADPAFTFTCGL